MTDHDDMLPIAIRLPKWLVDELDLRAKRTYSTRSQVIRVVLSAALSGSVDNSDQAA